MTPADPKTRRDLAMDAVEIVLDLEALAAKLAAFRVGQAPAWRQELLEFAKRVEAIGHVLAGQQCPQGEEAGPAQAD
jgi:hypothetical protein